MRKLLFLFALLLIFPLLAMAEDASALGVDVLSPIACGATADGCTLDLYCGPTQGFYRHDNQTLDLGSPYVFFGQFDCWAMVAQGTPDAFGPVGWVESALLETLPDTPELAFGNALAAMVEEDAPAVCDLQSRECMFTLTHGTEVILLAQYGDMLYVQSEIDGLPARVFIPANTVL